MRKCVLLAIFVFGLAACVSQPDTGGDSATASPTPTGTPPLEWTISMNSPTNELFNAFARLKSTSGNTTTCVHGVFPGNGTPLNLAAVDLHASTTYNIVELVIDEDASNTFDKGPDAETTDLIFTHAPVSVGAVTSTTINLSFDSTDSTTLANSGWAVATTSAFTWVLNTGCPGN